MVGDRTQIRPPCVAKILEPTGQDRAYTLRVRLERDSLPEMLSVYHRKRKDLARDYKLIAEVWNRGQRVGYYTPEISKDG